MPNVEDNEIPDVDIHIGHGLSPIEKLRYVEMMRGQHNRPTDQEFDRDLIERLIFMSPESYARMLGNCNSCIFFIQRLRCMFGFSRQDDLIKMIIRRPPKILMGRDFHHIADDLQEDIDKFCQEHPCPYCITHEYVKNRIDSGRI